MRPDGSDLRAIIARAPRALSRAGYYGLQPVAWLRNSTLLVGIRTEWGNQAGILGTRGRRLHRLAFYSDKSRRRLEQALYVDRHRGTGASLSAPAGTKR